MTKLRIPVVRFADGSVEAYAKRKKGEEQSCDEAQLSYLIRPEQVPIAIWWVDVDVPEVAPRLNSVVDVSHHTWTSLPGPRTYQELCASVEKGLEPRKQTWPGSNIPLPDGRILSSAAPIPECVCPECERYKVVYPGYGAEFPCSKCAKPEEVSE